MLCEAPGCDNGCVLTPFVLARDAVCALTSADIRPIVLALSGRRRGLGQSAGSDTLNQRVARTSMYGSKTRGHRRIRVPLPPKTSWEHLDHGTGTGATMQYNRARAQPHPRPQQFTSGTDTRATTQLSPRTNRTLRPR